MLKSPAVESRRVRTLYACVGEHDTELSFEPNQIITSSKFGFSLVYYTTLVWPFYY
jgi:hypothetical protein